MKVIRRDSVDVEARRPRGVARRGGRRDDRSLHGDHPKRRGPLSARDASTRRYPPVMPTGAILGYSFCVYWGRAPNTRSPVLSVGVAAGPRSLTELHAEMADYSHLDPVAVDHHFAVPAYLSTGLEGGHPALTLYVLKGSVEASVELGSADATAADLDKLGQTVLARI